VARFEKALAENTAPSRLGDVSLRYEPSMLIGETAKPNQSFTPTVIWLGGIAALLFAIAAIFIVESGWVSALLLAAGAALLFGTVRLERHEKRQRRFVANFATYSLRLDFTSPIAGQPRTVIVPFDSVKAVELLDAGILTVDVEHDGRVLREALVAFIKEGELEAAQRLERVLRGAFGLGEIPADSPIYAPSEESSFEPVVTKAQADSRS
jgi:HAMP domain-containing protein